MVLLRPSDLPYNSFVEGAYNRAMPRKPITKRAERPTPRSRKTDDPKQFERFVETAKRIGMDEDPEALDRAFDKIAPRRASSP